MAPMKRALFVWLLCCASCVAFPARADDAARSSLLYGKRPIAAAGVERTERITDGLYVRDGDHWRSTRTAMLPNTRARVVYDLGAVRPIRCALLQGDSNDVYQVSVSTDGKAYSLLWRASGQGSGMQLRATRELDASARFVELKPSGGDSHFSVAELGLYAECAAEWPPKLDRVGSVPLESGAEDKIKSFALFSMLLLVLAHARARAWLYALLALPLFSAALAFGYLVELWPFGENLQTLLRASTAAVAGVLLLRDHFSRRSWPFPRRVTLPVLSLLAVIGVGCMYHFGMPQFRDASKSRTTLVHTWDMRVYYPLAKYFTELRFDGLYLASLAAYLDNNKLSSGSIGHVRLRSLTNNEIVNARSVIADIDAVRTRFTPERWQQFTRDMRYFQDAMGTGEYLGSLRDHGGNATPAWILPAHLLFRWLPASELTLSLSALLDPLLLAAMFVAIARTFGLRPMLYCLLIFGVTDFSRFGSNLMGSTLRYDWMAVIGFAACALARRRWVLGGSLLAYGGMIRAFPALGVMFLPVPALWALVERFRAGTLPRRLPELWKQFRVERRPLLRTLAGAAGCVLALLIVSSALFSFRGSWVNWAQKISIHAEKPNANHVGLRTVVAYEQNRVGRKVIRDELLEPWEDWQKYQRAALKRRWPIYYGALIAFVGVAVLACRRRRLHEAALIGLVLIPVLSYPANYYCHYVFLLPLIAAARGHARPKLLGFITIVLCVMSVLQFFTLDQWSDETYTDQSWILLGGSAAILLAAAWTAWPGRGEWLLCLPRRSERRRTPAEPAADQELSGPEGATVSTSA